MFANQERPTSLGHRSFPFEMRVAMHDGSFIARLTAAIHALR
ncbi:MAG: hypothetical protein ABFS17_04160 [Chloroflexota bacterium]